MMFFIRNVSKCEYFFFALCKHRREWDRWYAAFFFWLLSFLLILWDGHHPAAPESRDIKRHVMKGEKKMSFVYHHRNMPRLGIFSSSSKRKEEKKKKKIRKDILFIGIESRGSIAFRYSIRNMRCWIACVWFEKLHERGEKRSSCPTTPLGAPKYTCWGWGSRFRAAGVVYLAPRQKHLVCNGFSVIFLISWSGSSVRGPAQGPQQHTRARRRETRKIGKAQKRKKEETGRDAFQCSVVNKLVIPFPLYQLFLSGLSDPSFLDDLFILIFSYMCWRWWWCQVSLTALLFFLKKSI